MVMYSNANRSHAVLFSGFASLPGDFVSSKVIRRGSGVLYAAAARKFHSRHEALANLRKPLQRWVGDSISFALGVVNKTSHAKGYAAKPAVKRTCLWPTAYL